MLANRVDLPLPLTRLAPWYPPQLGVAGAGADRGLRLHCTGNVFYVDPNFPGAHDRRDGTEPDAPLATVQAALDRCRPYAGDMVLVMASNAGPHAQAAWGRLALVTETVTISTPGVRLVGAAPFSAIGVYWRVPLGGWAITVAAPEVLVEGFAFLPERAPGEEEDPANGIMTSGSAVEGLTLRHCYFGADFGTALQLGAASDSEVYGCLFRGAQQAIFSEDDVLSCRILENWFYDCAAAVVCSAASGFLVAGNWFYSAATAAGEQAAGSMVNFGAGGGNAVFGNWFSCTGGEGGNYHTANVPGTDDAWAGNFCVDGLAGTVTPPEG
jgi:hypothetical protein